MSPCAYAVDRTPMQSMIKIDFQASLLGSNVVHFAAGMGNDFSNWVIASLSTLCGAIIHLQGIFY